MIRRTTITFAILLGCGETTAGDAGSSESTAGSSESSSTSPESTTIAPGTGEASSSSSGGSTGVADVSSDGSGSSGSSSDTGTPDDPGPDLRLAGPHPVESSSGSFPTGGCSMAYEIFTPTDEPDAPTVVLAHGFQGNHGSMVDWAEHFASWGLRVVTPDLCHATIVDADHAQNGADLVALAGELAIASPIYAGYSAGGLAAVLAAAQDPATVALVGLDMVDSGGLGAGVADGIAVPAHDITSEAAMCNSTANGVPVFGAMADSHVVRIVEADHCDFQSPGDAFCGLCSAPNPDHTTESIQAAIRGLSTAALLWRAGVDPRGEHWWTPGGVWYDEMIEQGALAQL